MLTNQKLDFCCNFWFHTQKKMFRSVMNLSSNDEGVYRALTSPLITERTLRTVRTQPKRQQPVEFFSFCYLQSFVIRSSPIASSHQDYADLLPKCSNSSDLHNIRELNLDLQHHVCLGKTIYEKGKSGWKKNSWSTRTICHTWTRIADRR